MSSTYLPTVRRERNLVTCALCGELTPRRHVYIVRLEPYCKAHWSLPRHELAHEPTGSLPRAVAAAPGRPGLHPTE